MTVEQFTLPITLNKKKLVANCSKFQPDGVNYPQIHSWCQIDEKEAITYTFYLLPTEVFWFNLNNLQRQDQARTIAKEIAKKFKLKVVS